MDLWGEKIRIEITFPPMRTKTHSRPRRPSHSSREKGVLFCGRSGSKRLPTRKLLKTAKRNMEIAKHWNCLLYLPKNRQTNVWKQPVNKPRLKKNYLKTQIQRCAINEQEPKWWFRGQIGGLTPNLAVSVRFSMAAAAIDLGIDGWAIIENNGPGQVRLSPSFPTPQDRHRYRISPLRTVRVTTSKNKKRG